VSRANSDERAAPDALSHRVEKALGAHGALAAGSTWNDRPDQRAMAGEIARAISEPSTLVAEAGTGIGKTFAYLVPALLAGGKVIISTGTKTLQDQLFARDLPRVIAALGVDVRTALLKGRANYVCRHHLKRNLEDGRFTRAIDISRLRQIDRFSRLSSTGDRSDCSQVSDDDPAWVLATSTRENCLGQDCADWNQCFVVQARRTAQSADVVVINHHLFSADLALRDTGIAELLPSAQTLIFDEAHQLPDTLVTFLGEASGSRALMDLGRDALQVALEEAPDQARWHELGANLDQFVRQARAEWPIASPRAPAHTLLAYPDFANTLQSVTRALEALTSALEAAAERGPGITRMAERARTVCSRWSGWFSEGAVDGAKDAEPSVAWAEVHLASLTLHKTPLSVAEPFTRYRDGTARAWIFVSATLAVGDDFSHFAQILGLSESRKVRFPSPFDYPSQGLLYVPTGLPEPSDPVFSRTWIEHCWPLIEANVGRCFVLCTTLRAVRQVADRLRELLEPPLTLMVQGEGSRTELLERFRAAPAPILVGAASFWEGVDVVGDALSLLLIDKLPFAPPDDPVLEAQSEALRRRGGDPFRTIQLPAASLALKQGAGRLIRSERDRGVLVIGDARLINKGYGRTLMASLPPFSVTRERQVAENFLVTAIDTKPKRGS
jgi:ATP-dependent DNA helicase DinG